VIPVKDLRALSEPELNQKLQEAYQELFNLRFRHATKQVENSSRIRVVKRDIARIQTVMRELQLTQSGGQQEQAGQEA
jgi:large subunit ribosomal protein L29